MKKIGIYLWMSAFLLAGGTLNADQKALPSDDTPGCFGAKTGKGNLLLACNYFNSPFTLEIKAKDLESGDNGGEPGVLLIVDGRLFQVEVVEISKFVGKKDDLKNTEALLKRHMQWEMDFKEQTLGVKLKPTFFLSKLGDGRPAAYWFLEYPESFHKNDPKKVKWDLLAVARVKSAFVVLYSPVTDSKGLKPTWKLLMDTLLTLEEKKADITAAQLKKEALGK